MERFQSDPAAPLSSDGAPFGACDRDPIHAPGHIQSYGTLIVVDAASGCLTHVTAPLIPGPDLQGITLCDLLGPEQADMLVAQDLAPDRHGLFRTWQATVRFPGHPPLPRSLIAHRVGDGPDARHILEFIPDHGPDHGPEEGHPDGAAAPTSLIHRLQTCPSVDGVLTEAARICRKITRFERVMIYRFGADGHGEIIREETDGETRFLGHFFPASDIPSPARALYLSNTIRLIQDIEAPTVPLVALSPEAAEHPIDLSHAVLRAVAPVHLTYLGNMGVRASLSISLVVRGELWGMILCHHPQPRRPASMVLQLLDMLGEVVSGAVERMVLQDQIARMRNASALSRTLTSGLSAFATEGRGTLLPDTILTQIETLAGCDGTRGMIAGRTVHHADAPLPDTLEPILADLAWDRVSLLNGLGNRLRDDGPGGTEPEGKAWGGGAFLPLDKAKGEYLFLARRCIVQNRRWGGSPHHDKRLGPRRSFETWRETVKGECAAFDPDTEEVLEILRQGLIMGLSARAKAPPGEPDRRAHKPGHQGPAEAPAPEASQGDHLSAMGDLASGLAHELNQPLASIINYATTCNLLLGRANAQASAATGSAHLVPLVETLLDEAKRAGEIVRRLRRFMQTGTFEPTLIDLVETVRVALGLALTPDQRRGLTVEFDAPTDLPNLLGDDVQVQQVVFNLIRNACDAMADQEERRLAVRIDTSDDGFVTVRVRDNGPGIAPTVIERMFDAHVTTKQDGMGIGLSLSRSIILAHGGTMGALNHETGAEVFFRLPQTIEETDGTQGTQHGAACSAS